jgi:hypothetical protein
VARYFHVSSSLNRESIRRDGLDWCLMGASPGIAGSSRPEAEGIFLAVEEDVEWFTRLNNTGGTVDVWAVDGIEPQDLVPNGSGYFYLPVSVPAARLTLLAADLPAIER